MFLVSEAQSQILADQLDIETYLSLDFVVADGDATLEARRLTDNELQILVKILLQMDHTITQAELKSQLNYGIEKEAAFAIAIAHLVELGVIKKEGEIVTALFMTASLELTEPLLVPLSSTEMTHNDVDLDQLLAPAPQTDAVEPFQFPGAGDLSLLSLLPSTEELEERLRASERLLNEMRDTLARFHAVTENHERLAHNHRYPGRDSITEDSLILQHHFEEKHPVTASRMHHEVAHLESEAKHAPKKEKKTLSAAIYRAKRNQHYLRTEALHQSYVSDLKSTTDTLEDQVQRLSTVLDDGYQSRNKRMRLTRSGSTSSLSSIASAAVPPLSPLVRYSSFSPTRFLADPETESVAAPVSELTFR